METVSLTLKLSSGRDVTIEFRGPAITRQHIRTLIKRLGEDTDDKGEWIGTQGSERDEIIAALRTAEQDAPSEA